MGTLTFCRRNKKQNKPDLNEENLEFRAGKHSLNPCHSTEFTKVIMARRDVLSNQSNGEIYSRLWYFFYIVVRSMVSF